MSLHWTNKNLLVASYTKNLKMIMKGLYLGTVDGSRVINHGKNTCCAVPWTSLIFIRCWTCVCMMYNHSQIGYMQKREVCEQAIMQHWLFFINEICNMLYNIFFSTLPVFVVHSTYTKAYTYNTFLIQYTFFHKKSIICLISTEEMAYII